MSKPPNAFLTQQDFINTSLRYKYFNYVSLDQTLFTSMILSTFVHQGRFNRMMWCWMLCWLT